MNFRRRASTRSGLVLVFAAITALAAAAAWRSANDGSTAFQAGVPQRAATAASAPADNPHQGTAAPPAWAVGTGDDSFLSAQTSRARGPIARGDDAALATFETTVAPGALTAIAANGDPVKGSFSPVVAWPLVGIHAVLTADGRVVSYGTRDDGIQTGYFIYDIWNPQLGLGSQSHTVLPNNTAVDIFCNAQLLLASGDIEMYGGDVVNLTYNWSTNQPTDDTNLLKVLDDSLVRTGKMHRKRWYATATTLPSGEVYIQGGSGGKDYPEVRTATGTFRLLTGASTNSLASLYPRNFLGPDGRIFGLANAAMYRVDPANTGSLVSLGNFPTSNTGGSSTAVMFRPDRVLQVGGGSSSSASLAASVIDIGNPTPVVTALPPVTYRRHWGNATVMADGRVLVSGGSTTNNDPANGVAYTSEIYDPATNRWSLGATAKQMRLYHSATLLLPDATVLTLGGGAMGNGGPGPQLNLNAEIYYPPYLFNADGTAAARPIISSAPMTAQPAQKIRIGTPAPAAIARVTLVKAGSVTHSFDMDQRFIELPFTVVGSELEASLPANAFHTPPGFYLVFVIDAQGVPSEAAMLRVNMPSQAPAALTVRKVVVNDDGGSKSAADFRFSVNGATPVTFEADGSNVLSVPAGTYTVTEPAVAGYVASYSGCKDIVLAAGGSATCTITNNDEAAPPSPENLLVNGDFETNSVPDGTRQLVSNLARWSNKAGPIPVWRNIHTPGRNQSFIEIEGAAGTIKNRIYQDVATVAGATYELSFLHSPRPGNSAASNRFDVYWNGARIQRTWIDGTGLTDTHWQRITLTVTGTGADRVSFFEDGADTDDRGALIDDVQLVRQGAGEPEPEPATLTVKKVVVNNDGGSKSAADFRFSVNGATPVTFEADGSNVLSVPAGTYTVTEPAVAGYVASYSGCNAVVLPAGGSATCTITNNDEAVAPTPDNLLVNGDFETNSVPDGTRQLVSNLSGWSNKAGPIPVWRNFYTPGRNQSFIEIEGAAGTVQNRIYQNVTTVAGATYELSFLHSPRPGNSAASNRFDVYWNGTRIQRTWIDGTGLTDTHWQRITLTVTGTGADRVSFFEDGADTDDRGALIDDVRLTRR